MRANTLVLIAPILLIGCGHNPDAVLYPLVQDPKKLDNIKTLIDYSEAVKQRPTVEADDPWSLTVSRIHISAEDADSSDHVALILKVDTGDDSPIDKQWILASVDKGPGNNNPGFTGNKNLTVWSGYQNNCLTITVDLIKLNKAKKEDIAKWTSIASKLTGFIPTYGTLVSEAVLAGAQIYNEVKQDYEEILSSKTEQFCAINGNPLIFTSYGLIRDDVWDKYGLGLWNQHHSHANEIMNRTTRLNSSWVGFTITKGHQYTFVDGTAKSVEEVRKLADSLIKDSRTPIDTAKFDETIDGIASSVSLTRVMRKFNARKIEKMKDALMEAKSAKLDNRLNNRDYFKLVAILKSYLPSEKIPTDERDTDAWIKSIQDLMTENYQYSDDKERWIK